MLLGKKHDLDSGDSVTILATKDDVAGAGGSSANLLFSDSYDADTRANYTYLIGASGDFAVAGGHLAPSNGQKLIYPTALAARADSVAKMHVNIGNTAGQEYAGIAQRIQSAGNHLMAYVDSDIGGVKLFQWTGGGGGLLASAAIPGGVRNRDLWLVSRIVGDRWTLLVYAEDPEGAHDGPIGSLSWEPPSPYGDGDASEVGRVGMWMNPGDAAVVINEFKVWDGPDLPFEI